MIYLNLVVIFFKIGAFSVGGGLATIPFLYEIAIKGEWFNITELTNMIAISESTPGPIGVNMATFSGIKVAGLAGGILTTISLVMPSILILFLLIPILDKYKESNITKNIFYVLRPTSAGLISSAFIYLLYNISFDIGEISLINILFLVIIALIYKNIKISPIVIIFSSFIIAGLLGL